jgi:thymidylate synthase
MNNLDKSYQALLQDILDNGVKKEDRTGTGTISVFGRQIKHKMSEGFPLITTKKMFWKGILTELVWFLRGDTNIKFLIDNNCHIWDGDAYKNYINNPDYKAESVADLMGSQAGQLVKCSTQEEFVKKIKTDDEFAKKWGDLGPVYGKQWRSWETYFDKTKGWMPHNYDQIANLIHDLKNNPDSRRLMVNAWNVGELDQMTLPPCHYGFQVYTRELSSQERVRLYEQKTNADTSFFPVLSETLDFHNIPTRAISLQWSQRSVDTFLGLPFNIASYGLLLEIIAKAVNMVPDELIGNLGDTHLYLNHIEQAKEQIGRDLTVEERGVLYRRQQNLSDHVELVGSDRDAHRVFDDYCIMKSTRESYPLPTLNINTEFWPTESGECGIGAIDAVAVFNNFTNEHFCKCLLEEDIQLGNYHSHPTIKAPLSN